MSESKPKCSEMLYFSQCIKNNNEPSSCLEYVYYDKSLYINHVNAYHNCGTINLRISAMLINDGIFIDEYPVFNNYAGCFCHFQAMYVIRDIEPGTYRISVKQPNSSLAVDIIGLINLWRNTSGAIRIDERIDNNNPFPVNEHKLNVTIHRFDPISLFRYKPNNEK